MAEKGEKVEEIPIGFKLRPDEKILVVHISGYPNYHEPVRNWAPIHRMNTPVMIITNYRLIFSHSTEFDLIDSEWLSYTQIPWIRIEKDKLVIYTKRFEFKRYRIYYDFQFVKKESEKFIPTSDNMEKLQEINELIQNKIKQAWGKPETKRQIVTNKLKHEVWRRDKFTCQYCGRTINEVELEIDHILPVSKGGETIRSNLQTLCEDCNKKKSDR